MSFSIENDYSVLNSYNYNDKLPLLDTLDELSTPCRRVWGGRNICVLSQSDEHLMSTGCRVVTLFFSILIFPIAVVSVASLALKCMMFPWLWEKEQVRVQSEMARNALHQFGNAFQAGQYDEAIDIVRQHPEIRFHRSEISDNLFTSINQRIDGEVSWEMLAEQLRLLDHNHAIELINEVIRTQLLDEFEENFYLTSADQVIDFVHDSLTDNEIEDIEACYERLLSDALQVDAHDHALLNIIKMDIGNGLIRSLIERKRVHAYGGLTQMGITHQETLFRQIMLNGAEEVNDDYFPHYLLLNSENGMSQIEDLLQEIRDINQRELQWIEQINVLLKGEETDFGLICRTLQNDLNPFTASVDEKDQSCFRSVNQCFDLIIKLSDQIKTGCPEKTVAFFGKQLERNLSQQKGQLSNWGAQIDGLHCQTSLERVLAVLRLQKRVCLLGCTANMQTLLLHHLYR